MADMMSGVSGAGGGDMMRLVGMASGLDVDGTVKKMLIGDQRKVDVAKQQREALVWKQEAYREIVKETKALQDKYFNATSKDSLLNSKNYSDYNVNSTNEAVATAIGKAGAVEGIYKIDVKQMAKGASTESSQIITIKDKKKASVSSKLSDVGITNNEMEFNYFQYNNGKKEKENNIKITIGKDDKISDLVGKINKEGNGCIKARYSELTGKLSIETNQTGKCENLEIIKGLNTIKINSGTSVQGTDAEVILTEPGGGSDTVTKESNSFTIDGINYNLTGTGNTTLSVSQDADKTFDRVKGFIDDYNALVGSITKKLTEKKQYSYKPLTENQKKGMKDSEIKAWEEKAKQGVLRNDPNLERMLRELRGTFFGAVPQAGIKFGRNDLGLDTTNEVSTAGQIKFTPGGEEKLKKALKEKPDEVMKLFVGNYELTSDDIDKIEKNKLAGLSSDDERKYGYLKNILNDPKQGIEKAKEKFKSDNSGIFQKMNSILKDYVGISGTTLNSAILTKYANKQNDFTYAGTGGNNNIPDQIYRKDKVIKDLMSKMRAREEQLYKQFSKLETVMNRYNAQAGWLAQQFGG